MKDFHISHIHRMYSVNPQTHTNHNKQTQACYFPKTSSSIGLMLNCGDDVYHVFVNSKTGCSGRLPMVATMTGSGFYHISVVLWTAHSRGSGLTERQHCSNSQMKRKKQKGWHNITIQQDHQNDMTLNLTVLLRLYTAASDGERVFGSKARQQHAFLS